MTSVASGLVELVTEVLDLELLDGGTDLIETGLMDSLALVSLLAAVEERYRVTIDFATLELDDVRSVDALARFLERTAPTA